MKIWTCSASFLGLLTSLLGRSSAHDEQHLYTTGTNACTATATRTAAQTPVFQPAMSVGSDCSSCEGEWNCLTTAFQRCASGRWSNVMVCAAGTMCQPVGLSFDNFHIVNSGESVSSTAGTATPTPYLYTPLPSYTHTPSCASSCVSPSAVVNASEQGGGFISGTTASGGDHLAGRLSNSGLSMATVAGVGAMAIAFARMLM